MAALRTAFRQAAAGRMGAVLIAGEAGVGKSRLVAEFAAELPESEAFVLVGQGVALGEHEIPYAPVMGALRSLPTLLSPDELDEVAGPMGRELAGLVPGVGEASWASGSGATDAFGRARLFELLLGLLGRLGAQRSAVVVIEDLHWADGSTRDLLRFVVRSASTERLLLVLTYRSDDLHRAHPARPYLAELGRDPRVDPSRVAAVLARGARGSRARPAGRAAERCGARRAVRALGGQCVFRRGAAGRHRVGGSRPTARVVAGRDVGACRAAAAGGRRRCCAWWRRRGGEWTTGCSRRRSAVGGRAVGGVARGGGRAGAGAARGRVRVPSRAAARGRVRRGAAGRARGAARPVGGGARGATGAGRWPAARCTRSSRITGMRRACRSGRCRRRSAPGRRPSACTRIRRRCVTSSARSSLRSAWAAGDAGVRRGRRHGPGGAAPLAPWGRMSIAVALGRRAIELAWTDRRRARGRGCCTRGWRATWSTPVQRRGAGGAVRGRGADAARADARARPGAGGARAAAAARGSHRGGARTDRGGDRDRPGARPTRRSRRRRWRRASSPARANRRRRWPRVRRRCAPHGTPASPRRWCARTSTPPRRSIRPGASRRRSRCRSRASKRRARRRGARPGGALEGRRRASPGQARALRRGRGRGAGRAAARARRAVGVGLHQAAAALAAHRGDAEAAEQAIGLARRQRAGPGGGMWSGRGRRGGRRARALARRPRARRAIVEQALALDRGRRVPAVLGAAVRARRVGPRGPGAARARAAPHRRGRGGARRGDRAGRALRRAADRRRATGDGGLSGAARRGARPPGRSARRRPLGGHAGGAGKQLGFRFHAAAVRLARGRGAARRATRPHAGREPAGRRSPRRSVARGAAVAGAGRGTRAARADRGRRAPRRGPPDARERPGCRRASSRCSR